MKTLWLVGGGFESVPGIERARALGLRVVVSDGDPAAPGLACADEGVVVSTYDAEGTLREVRAYQERVGAIDGISCVAADVPFTVAYAASQLGLPGIPVRAARLSMDKLAMKDVLTARGIRVPAYAAIRDARDLAGWLERFEYVVVKPVDSRGARGVLRLDREIDREWAFEEARRHSPSRRVMVEEYVAGPQVSTEGMLIGGHSHPVAVNDRNYEFLDRFHPYVIENGGSHPTALSADAEQALAELALEAGRALGVSDGVVKGDMVLSARGPMVIEVALRLSGGFFSTHQIPLSTGVDLVGASLAMAVGEPPSPEDLVPARRSGVAIRYVFPEPGIVRSVSGVDALAGGVGLELVRMNVAEGDAVGDPHDHTERAGCVLATGVDAGDAIARARHAVRSISVETASPPSRSGLSPSPGGV